MLPNHAPLSDEQLGLAQPVAADPQAPAPMAGNDPASLLAKLKGAIKGVESGGIKEPSAALSPQGASGSMQVMPGTFKQYAKPGESYANEADRIAVGERKIEDDFAHYGGDPAKTAAAYIGGRGAVLPNGTIRNDVKDALGTTPLAYASRVLKRMSGVSDAHADPVPGAKDLQNNAAAAPPTWAQVTQKPEFKALSGEDQELMRNQYWDEVVLPRVPLGEEATYRQEFDTDTKPSAMTRVGRALQHGVQQLANGNATGATVDAIRAGVKLIDEQFTRPRGKAEEEAPRPLEQRVQGYMLQFDDQQTAEHFARADIDAGVDFSRPVRGDAKKPERDAPGFNTTKGGAATGLVRPARVAPPAQASGTLANEVRRGVEGIKNSFDGWRMAEIAAVLEAKRAGAAERGVTPEQLAADPEYRADVEAYRQYRARIEERNAQMEKLPRSSAVKKMFEGEGAEGVENFVNAFREDPKGATAVIVGGSAPASLAMISAALLARVGLLSPTAAAGAGGVTSAFIEFGNNYQEARTAGQGHDEAFNRAAVKSSVIGLFDAVSLGSAGKALDVITQATGIKAAAKKTVKEVGKQAVLGGGGETIGSVATGEMPQPGAVMGEIVGEAVMGVPEGVGSMSRPRAAGAPPAGGQPAADAAAPNAPSAPISADDFLGAAPAPIDEAAHQAATSPTNDKPEPTEGQKGAGNYELGHYDKIAGIDLSIENPHGSERKGVDENGKPWSTTMTGHYGYIKGVPARAPEENGKPSHVDVFVVPGTPDDFSGSIFVVDQNRRSDGAFDEPKVIIGAASLDDARKLYLANYDKKQASHIRGITEMPLEAFKAKLQDVNAFMQPQVPAAAAKKAAKARKVVPDSGEKPAVRAGKSKKPPVSTIDAPAIAPPAGAIKATPAVAPDIPENIPAPEKPARSPAQLANDAKLKSRARTINTKKDTLFQAIAKLGGLDKAAAIAEWGTDPKDRPQSRIIGKPVWRREGGLSLDDMATQLAQFGYLTLDEDGRVDLNELAEKFDHEMHGRPQRAADGIEAAADERKAMLEEEEDAKAELAVEGLEATPAKMIDMTLLGRAIELDPDAVDNMAVEHDGNDAAFMAALQEFVDARQPGNAEDDRRGEADGRQAPSKAGSGGPAAAQDPAAPDPRGEQHDAQPGPGQSVDANLPPAAAQRDGARDADARSQSSAGADQPSDGLELSGQTAADLNDRAQRRKRAEVEQAEAKAIADRERDAFALAAPAGAVTADPLASPKNQRDLLAAPAAEPEDAAIAKAKADLNDALADLGDIFGKNVRKNITPEQEQRLLPVMTKVMDAAFRLGFHSFKKAARFVLDTIRDKVGADIAAQISLDHLQGAYIAMSGRYRDSGADSKRDVINVESLDELVDEPSAEAPAAAPARGKVLEQIDGDDGMAAQIFGNVEPGKFNVALRDRDAGETVSSIKIVNSIDQARAEAYKLLNISPEAAGARDFAAGKKRAAPAWLAVSIGVGLKSANQRMTEYLRGWDKANLAAPVPASEPETVKRGEKGTQRQRLDPGVKRYLGAKRPSEWDIERIVSYRTEALTGLREAIKENADDGVIAALHTEHDWAVANLALRSPGTVESLGYEPSVIKGAIERSGIDVAAWNQEHTTADGLTARGKHEHVLDDYVSWVHVSGLGINDQVRTKDGREGKVRELLTIPEKQSKLGKKTHSAARTRARVLFAGKRPAKGEADAQVFDDEGNAEPSFGYGYEQYHDVADLTRVSGPRPRSRGVILESEGDEHAADTGSDLESDSGARPPEDAMGDEPVRDGSGRDDGAAGSTSPLFGEAIDPRSGDHGVSVDDAAADGARSNQPVHNGDGKYGTAQSAAGSPDAGRSGATGDSGVEAEPERGAPAIDSAPGESAVTETRNKQRAAQRVSVVPGDLANIAQSLPFLKSGQQDDVKIAEDRFAKSNGHGVLFTNGTGTGKTFTGLGVVKRFERQGKDNTIILVPTDSVGNAWVESGRELLLNIAPLADSRSNGGKGIVITTYANFGQNPSLVEREWDLVLADEAHYLSSNQAGEATLPLRQLRGLTGHPDGFFTWLHFKEADLYAQLEAIRQAESDQQFPDRDKILAGAEELRARQREVEKVRRTEYDARGRAGKALFLSATPFAYVQSVDWAEGYLFDYDRNVQSKGYNTPSNGRDAFMAQHFGYRFRTGKLTQPDANVDRGLMEVNFNQHLKDSGALSGRILEVDQDYERLFATVDAGIGRVIDEGMEWLREADSGRYRHLHDIAQKRFEYLDRAFLLESIKARAFVPLIKDHLKLGRKVVVFHDYNKGGGFHPFSFDESSDELVTAGNYPNQTQEKLGELVREFNAKRADLADSKKFTRLSSPIETFARAFPNALFINGTVPKKKRIEAKHIFNSDDSGRNLIVAQSDAAREGVSLHDTTGKHPRVLFNLGLPVKPTAAIQIEGRIMRLGVKSNALYVYGDTGTSFERHTFAAKISERASTAENLALGADARGLKQSFIDAYMDSGAHVASLSQGTGGKARDRATRATMTPFQKAKSYYWGQQKKTSRTKAAEGVDYFATPEPLALKMVEWAGIRPGDELLEPSAGHGAIARWFPALNPAKMVEPSSELGTRAMLVSGAELVASRFESFHIVNKADVIVMNPPFGVGGKTAMEHLEKAMIHARDGARIVALLPRGPTADKRLEKLLYPEDDKARKASAAKDVYLAADIELPSVTFERAGTSVRAHVVVLDKVADPKNAPHQVSRDYSDAEDIKAFFEAIEHGTVPDRPEKPQEAQAAAAAPLAASRDAVLPSAARQPQEGGASAVNGYTFSTKVAEKSGKTWYVAAPGTRLAGDEWTQAVEKAKAHKGWYSRSYRGFAFPSEEARQAFAGGTVLSRSGIPGSMKRADVNAVANLYRSKLKGLPPVYVHQSLRQAPAELVRGIKALGGENDTAGAWHNGEIYLFGDNLRSPQHASWVLLHEATHHGLRGSWGGALDPVLMGIYLDNANVRAAASKLRKALGGTLSDVRATEEVLANMGGDNLPQSIWQRLIAGVRKILRRMGVKLEITDADVRGLVADALRHVKSPSKQTHYMSGTVMASGETDTPAFKRWFGESKVVDENGEPLVVYHGTHGDFDVFKGSRSYFTADPAYASEYADDDGGNVMPVFLSLQNPIDLYELGTGYMAPADFLAALRKRGVNTEPLSRLDPELPVWAYIQMGPVREAIIAAGFDGVIQNESIGEGDGRRHTKAYVTFKPTQIKSAIGNNGDFDPTKPSIALNRSAGGTGTAPVPRRTGAAIDAAFRIPTQALGVDRLTGWAYDTLLEKTGGLVPEIVKAGLVSDYGIPEAVTDRRDLMQSHMRSALRRTESVIEKLMVLTRAESRVAYEWMTGQTEESALEQLPEDSRETLARLRETVSTLGAEAVRLGQLPADVHERTKLSYLHRSYLKHETEQGEQAKASRARAIKVLGDQYKGRGMTDGVPMQKIRNSAPEWWERKLKAGQGDKGLKGELFIRLERRANRGQDVDALPGMENTGQLGKLLEVAYWPAGEPVPVSMADWRRDAGEWVVRDVQGPKAIMWRDFTKDERVRMGEIDEVRYAVAKTLQQMIHDIEVGRYFEWLAQRYAQADGDGLNVVEASESMFRSFTKDEWVKVPDTKVTGTSALRYGKLAGQYLPGPIWNDVRQIGNQVYQPLGETFATVMKAWKISKTALSPAVHMNNVMANVIMADWHDVLARDIYDALRAMIRGNDQDKALIAAFEDNGGTQGVYLLSEIQRDQMKPLLEALERDIGKAGGAGVVNAVSVVQALLHTKGVFGRMRAGAAALGDSKAAGLVKKGADAMMDAYQAEDTVFRLAAFIKAKAEGKTDTQAGKFARKSFLDYHINAPWVQMMRSTAFPFVSFVYRAAPMMLETAARKPWKLMKLASVLGGLNALGYMLSGGDEEKERKLLPDEKRGKVLGFIAPKLIRMPWNDAHGSPVFLDIRRFIPVGDIVDVGQTHAAVPLLPAMIPGGPIVLFGEVVANKQLFTGKPISKEHTDTATEKAVKVAEHLYKAFAPNLPFLPGTYSSTAIVNAGSGKTDAFGREQSVTQAVLSSVGVKVAAYPRDAAMFGVKMDRDQAAREISENIGTLKREYIRKGITREEFDDKVADQIVKRREIDRKAAERLR